MEEKQPIGYLFESIAIYDTDSLNIFLEKLTVEQAFYVVIQALEMANKKGIYTLRESEILSKSLRLLEKPPTVE